MPMHIKYLINSPDEPSFNLVCVITGWRLTTLGGLLQTAQADPVVQTARGVKLVHIVTGKSLPQVTGDDLTGLVVVHAPDGLTLDPEGVLTGVRELLYLGDGLDVTWGARCVVTYIDPGVVLNARVSCKKKINNVIKSLRFVDRILFFKGGGAYEKENLLYVILLGCWYFRRLIKISDVPISLCIILALYTTLSYQNHCNVWLPGQTEH